MVRTSEDQIRTRSVFRRAAAVGGYLGLAWCVLVLAGCEDSTTSALDAGRDRGVLTDARPDGFPDVTGNQCRLNSDCLPGLFCNESGRCDLECREDRDCLSERCVSGQCRTQEVAPDRGVEGPRDATRDAADLSSCRRDLDCGRGFVCEDSACVAGCPMRPCPPGLSCDQAAARCVATGCAPGECPEGERCNQDSGRCESGPEPEPPSGELGTACEAAADCASRLCIDVSVEGQQHTVCASPCCSEFDCPLGFGCRYTLGVGICLPSRIYPEGYSFDAAMGQACGRGGRACQSGLCDLGQDRCIGVCCTDADCGGRFCQVQPVGGGARAICGVDLLGLGRTGQGCANEFSCLSGICVPVPGGVGGQPGQCADLCCRNQDCAAGTLCGQVVTLGNITSACVPLPAGPSARGADCDRDEDCATGQCVEGTCREPCCRDGDCPGAERCLPRPNDEGSFVRVCVPDGR